MVLLKYRVGLIPMGWEKKEERNPCFTSTAIYVEIVPSRAKSDSIKYLDRNNNMLLAKTRASANNTPTIKI